MIFQVLIYRVGGLLHTMFAIEELNCMNLLSPLSIFQRIYGLYVFCFFSYSYVHTMFGSFLPPFPQPRPFFPTPSLFPSPQPPRY
jgi:hypothetical protein